MGKGIPAGECKKPQARAGLCADGDGEPQKGLEQVWGWEEASTRSSYQGVMRLLNMYRWSGKRVVGH